MRIFLLLITSSLYLFLVSPGLYAGQLEIKVNNGNSISVARLQSAGQTSLLWLPSEHGLTEGDKQVSNQLSKLGVDVWLVDLLNSYFLPPVASSINKLPDDDISRLIDEFLLRAKKQKFVLASGRSAVVLLRALKISKRPDGVMLISPNLYTATPEPGNKAIYLPITSSTKQDIIILQPQLSPWYWQREKQLKVLESGGSQVGVKVLKGVRDRFYFRPDAMASEQSLEGDLPKILLEKMKSFKSRSGK